jgi:hypothetical protein
MHSKIFAENLSYYGATGARRKAMLYILICRKHLTPSDILIVDFVFMGTDFMIIILGCVLQTCKDLQQL